MKQLNPKQKRFAELYCGECLGNAERAAIAAGYSPRYVRGNAYKLVANSGIKAYIKEINEKNAPKKIATIQEIQAFWTDVMNDEEEIMKNRIRASELLAKAKGAFNMDW